MLEGVPECRAHGLPNAATCWSGCCTLASTVTGCAVAGADSVLSGGIPTRLAFFDARRVGLRVHLRFLPAQREHGNFLSHFVLVFAQLLQAIGVRPADLGIMPFTADISCWFWSRPWTV